jgi:hypothetical protein
VERHAPSLERIPDACPCGSGQKFKRCCGSVSPGFPVVPEESAWQLLVEHLTQEELVRFVDDPALPPAALALLAAEMEERALTDPARAALARRFARPEAVDERYEAALDLFFKLKGEAQRMDDFVHWANELDPTWDRSLLGPILERAAAIVRASVARAGPAVQVPWSFWENRPALRLLSRLGYRLDEHDREGDAAVVYEEVLRLNPQDNHGHRSWLVDHYLRKGEDTHPSPSSRPCWPPRWHSPRSNPAGSP